MRCLNLHKFSKTSSRKSEVLQLTYIYVCFRFLAVAWKIKQTKPKKDRTKTKRNEKKRNKNNQWNEIVYITRNNRQFNLELNLAQRGQRLSFQTTQCGFHSHRLRTRNSVQYSICQSGTVDHLAFPNIDAYPLTSALSLFKYLLCRSRT